MFSIKIRPCGQIYTMIAAESKMLQRWHRPGICVETRLQISHSQLPISQRSVPDSYESAIHKGPFIATQLNSTRRRVELCRYKWGFIHRECLSRFAGFAVYSADTCVWSALLTAQCTLIAESALSTCDRHCRRTMPPSSISFLGILLCSRSKTGSLMYKFCPISPIVILIFIRPLLRHVRPMASSFCLWSAHLIFPPGTP